MDVLYTIKYKVGADTEMSAHRDQLYVYAQKAFDVTPEQHRRYMAIVHDEKVSKIYYFSAIILGSECSEEYTAFNTGTGNFRFFWFRVPVLVINI